MRIVETNVSGFTFVIDWFYHYFKVQSQGHIVVVTSVAGLRGNRVAPAYFVSKAFQINYLEGLRQKCTRERSNIFVTDIRPGFVDTDMLSSVCKKSTSFSVFDFKDNADASVCTRHRAFEGFEFKEFTSVND